MVENYYNFLEIDDYSEISDVKKAFRRLAMKYHPDLNPDKDTSDKFKNILRAYETLKDIYTKKKYDELLKSGFDLTNFYKSFNTESDSEIRRKQFFRMRKEKDELEEIENLVSYEKSLLKFPFKFRITIIVFSQITAILLVLRDWYAKESFIAWGSFLFFAINLVLWNELYKIYWHKKIRNTDEKSKKSYDKLAYSHFIKILFGGILTLILLINAKKMWHLHYFPIYVYAENDIKHSILIYEYNKKEYVAEYFLLPDSLKNKTEVLIKISCKEPQIWDFAR